MTGFLQSKHYTALKNYKYDNSQTIKNSSLQSSNLFLDYSKNLINDEVIKLLVDLAKEANLSKAIEAYFSGERINYTENRAVLHTALRNQSNDPVYVDGKDVMPEIRAVQKKMAELVEVVQSGDWKGYSGESITDVVNIGIGGSDLGPEMVYRALIPYKHERINGHFISNLDSANLKEVLKDLNPKTTLFVIVSKTFTTQETLTNAHAARDWMLENGCDEKSLRQHFIAVSACVEKAVEFGIAQENILPMWDWVGGRFSVSSAVSLTIALTMGMDNFQAFLKGAYDMDCHFRQTPFDKNMPVILALLGIWYINFFQAETYAVLPYSYYLRLLPDYLQQAYMESLGKRVDNEGNIVDYATGAILWGGAGTNTQHSFHQLLFQGTHCVPIDFILPLSDKTNTVKERLPIIAHCLGQAQLFMQGLSEEKIVNELKKQGLSDEEAKKLACYKAMPGHQPNNMIVLETLCPESLGALIALYEHKIFVQSVIWRINAYDQWGVERGKILAKQVLKELEEGHVNPQYDSSTQALIKKVEKLA